MIKYYNLFIKKDFLNLFFGSLFANFGQSMATITIIWTVYDKTNNPYLIAVSLMCLELPVMLFGPILGNLLDKYKITTMINYSNLSRGLLFMLLIIFPLTSMINYIIFFVLVIISSSLVPISKSGEIILIGRVTNKQNLILANSVMNIQFDLSIIFGSLAGGLILAIGIGEKIFLLNGILFIISFLFFFFINEKAVVGNRKEEHKNKSNLNRWVIDIKEGLKYISSNKIILSLISVSFFWNFLIWGTAPTLTPIFTLVKIDAGPNGYGILNAATSFGIIFGSLLAGMKSIKISLLNLVLLSVGFHGLFYGLFGFSNNILIASIILIIAGTVSAPAMIYSRTLMQNIVPENIQGRVFTVSSTASTLGFPVGNFIAASYLGFVGENKVSYLFLLCGGFVFLFCFVLLVLWRRKDNSRGNFKSGIYKKIESSQSGST